MSEPDEDFAAMFEASIKAKRFRNGQTIEGTIVAIGPEVAFVNVGGKGEATIDVGELKDFAHLTYQSGSEPRLFAANLLRLLQGHSDGREQAAHAYACEHLDWREIVRSAEAEIAKRAGLAGKP